MANSEPLGLALVGCGGVVVNMHLNGWTRFPEKARLRAVFDVDASRAERMADLIQQAYAARSFEVVNSYDADYAEEPRRWIADEPPMPADGATTHDEAFVDAIGGGPAMLTQPESTRAQVELARAIGRSLAEKRPVSLPLRPGDPFYGTVDGYDRAAVGAAR